MDTATRVAARFAAQQTTTASSLYTPLMTELVKIVDDVERSSKNIDKAETILKRLEKLFEDDMDVNDGQKLDGVTNRRYGLQQHIGYLREALEAAEKAAKNLAETYDTANSWFLEKGIK